MFRNIWPPSADNLAKELGFITPKLLPAPAHLRAPQRSNKRRRPGPNQQKIQARTAPFQSQPKLPFSRNTNIQKRTGSKQSKKPSNSKSFLRAKSTKKNNGPPKQINHRKSPQTTPLKNKDLKLKTKYQESRIDNGKGKRPLPPNSERKRKGPFIEARKNSGKGKRPFPPNKDRKGNGSYQELRKDNGKEKRPLPPPNKELQEDGPLFESRKGNGKGNPEPRKGNGSGKRPFHPNKNRPNNGPQGMLTASAQKIGQKLAKVQLGGKPLSSILDFMQVPGRNGQNKRNNFRPSIENLKAKFGGNPRPVKPASGQALVKPKVSNPRKPNGNLKPGRKANSKNGRRPNNRPKKGLHPRRRKHPNKRPRYPPRKQRPFKRENSKPKSQPKASNIDSYGAPQAPVVDTNIDSYGSPNAPAISNQDSYGAPQAPAVSDSYGAPQAPVYNSGGSKAKDSPPPPPPPPPSDDGYESDLISSFRPVSEEDPVPYPTPDISQSSFGGFNDNLDASVSSFADEISDLSGYAEDEEVQTYNGYFTQDRASYEQSESDNENIKPFSNYFDGFDKSDNPTQSSVFSAKSDKIKYYDENGNLINPEKFKPIDYTPDYFESLGTTTNRRAFESDSKNRNGNKNFGFVGKEDDNYPPFTDINPRRRSQSTNRISTSNPASDSLSSAPSIDNIEPFVGGSGFEKSAPEPEKIKEFKPPTTTATPYNNIVYKGNFGFNFYIRGLIQSVTYFIFI